MDLRLLSKDHAVTVAVCDDTLTEIRYTTLKDTTFGSSDGVNGRDRRSRVNTRCACYRFRTSLDCATSRT